MSLPLEALRLLFRSKTLLLLSVLPGLLTLMMSIGGVYSLWTFSLVTWTPWLAVPVAIVVFILLWIVFGNISLLPVEDVIVDFVQKAHWGEIKIPSPRFSFRRLFRELTFSIFVMGATVVFLMMSLIPGVALLSFIAGAWISAYGFLATFYSRTTQSARARLGLFLRKPIAHFALGACFNILLFIPLLNVFVLGYALILATLFAMKEYESA